MTLIDHLTYSYRRVRYREQPLPRIGVHPGFTIPGAVVRLLAVASVGLCLGLACSAVSFPLTPEVILIVAFCVWGLVRPSFGVAIAALGVAAFFLLISNGAPFNHHAPWIIMTGYLALRLTMAAALISWRMKVAPSAVLTWRDAVVAGLTALVGLAMAVPGLGIWAAVIGLIMVIVVALLLSWSR